MKLFESCFKAPTWLLASLLAFLVLGCGGGGGGGGDSGGSSTSGTLGVSLTDAPACGFDAVNVTVTKVRVHQSSSATDTDAGWVDIALVPARKINLLNLMNGVLENLGETPLAAGHYTQVRLVLDPNAAADRTNSVVPSNGFETPLITPSEVQSGIKLINEFDVASGQRVDLVLDFDACRSIIRRGDGTFALEPVIRVVPFARNGIDGFVDPALLGSNVMVTAQQNGAVIQSTAPNPQTGEFFLSRLVPGNYDVAVTTNRHATAVIAAVPVATTTSVVAVSTSAAPIRLPVVVMHTISGTAILNPPSSTGVSYVAAKQTLGTAGTAAIVTVQLVAADDLTTGTYSLTLPSAAPQLGLFSGALPIGFVSQPGVAGKYTVEASASGYQTQLVSKDISAADATQSFVLVP